MTVRPLPRPLPRPTPRLGAVLAVLLAGVVATAALLFVGGTGSPDLDQRVAAVSADLRCPTCAGESVAQSNAPMARSMRNEVRAQLRAGRSPDQVRAWFRARYGDEVLMTPTGSMRWVLWGAPPVVLLGGLLILARVLARRRRSRPGPAGRADPLGPFALTVAAVVLLVVGVGVAWSAARPRAEPAAAAPPANAPNSSPEPTAADAAQRLDDAGRYDEAVAAWRRVLDERPASAVVRTRLAFDLLRTDRPAAVPALVRSVAHRPGPQRATALLVLGLAQRDLGRAQATATLRSFVETAPDHPAVDQVRRLLGDR